MGEIGRKQQFVIIQFNNKMNYQVGQSECLPHSKTVVVPRINQGSHIKQPPIKNCHLEQGPANKNSFSSPKINIKYYQPQKLEAHKKSNKKPIYQCKQNLLPIIFEQKKTQIIQRNFSYPMKRPLSSYQPPHFNIIQNYQYQPVYTTKFTLPDFHKPNMDSVCSKMTESIILSSDTLDSTTEMGSPLSIDNFQKVRFLGQGKFGQVHLVKHKLTGFIGALKIIDKKVVRQQKVQAQIAKQLRIHNKLKSLNIIDFYGFFDDQKYFYILLEFATQGSVFSKLKGRNRFEEEQIQPIAKGLCDGLRFMHRMGYVHRDIKPENIVLQFGVPKICDFGWATDCDDMHLCKSYCGTPLYLSPQMVRKQFYGNSVDVWAVGMVAYELLVGRVPFSIWGQQDMTQILNKPIEFPEYIDRSQKCQSFIRKCLERQTFNRIQLSDALKHAFLVQTQQANLEYEFFEEVNRVFNNT